LDHPEIQVLAVVTRPIEDEGKRRKTAANPVRDLASQTGLTIFDPADCNQPAFIVQLQALQADLFFVCDYGQILSRDCLAISRLGGINLHGSLLPKYRGAAPVQWAIYHGERSTGVSVIHMTPRMDAGPILSTVEVEILAGETAAELEPRLSERGSQAVLDAIGVLKSWDRQSPIGTPQDPTLASKAPRLTKADGQIDWRRNASQIVNQIRAFTPWPGSYCLWRGSDPPSRWIVHRASVAEIETGWPPGTIIAASSDTLAIQTGDQALAIEQIQAAGKKIMPIADFLRGNTPQVGQQVY
jgi:methionyl-tRNA formyltransferase